MKGRDAKVLYDCTIVYLSFARLELEYPPLLEPMRYWHLCDPQITVAQRRCSN